MFGHGPDTPITGLAAAHSGTIDTHADSTRIDEKLPAAASCITHARRPLAADRQRSTPASAANFAYIAITLDDNTAMPLMRLRYGGSANRWGFAIHLASTGKYEDSIPAQRRIRRTAPEEALDCACGLYLADPTAWLPPPTN